MNRMRWIKEAGSILAGTAALGWMVGMFWLLFLVAVFFLGTEVPETVGPVMTQIIFRLALMIILSLITHGLMLLSYRAFPKNEILYLLSSRKMFRTQVIFSVVLVALVWGRPLL